MTDDTATIQSALNSNGIFELARGQTYTITSRLLIPSGGRLVGYGESTIIMGSGVGQFDNAVGGTGNRFDANALGILADGARDVLLADFRIKYQSQVEDRFVNPIGLRNSSKIKVRGVEAWNFTKAAGLITIAGCTYGEIKNNWLHDCHTNSAIIGQITGIEVDNTAGPTSSYLDISGNLIERLTVGASFLTAFGYQTDGITIAHNNSRSHTIGKNKIRHVGEGIDTFGERSTLSENLISDTYYYGLKAAHGGAFNTFAQNQIYGTGIAGIAMEGSATASRAVERNLIVGNHIVGAGMLKDAFTGLWIMPFSGSSTSCLRASDNGGTTYAPQNNTFMDNYLDASGIGAHCIATLGSQGSGNRFVNNRGMNWAVAQSLNQYNSHIVYA